MEEAPINAFAGHSMEIQIVLIRWTIWKIEKQTSFPGKHARSHISEKPSVTVALPSSYYGI